MQVSIYISEQDFETHSKNKPAEFDTVSKFLADVIRKNAEQLRSRSA